MLKRVFSVIAIFIVNSVFLVGFPVVAKEQITKKVDVINPQVVGIAIKQGQDKLAEVMWQAFVDVYGKQIKTYSPTIPLERHAVRALVRTYVMLVDIKSNSAHVVDTYGLYNGPEAHGLLLTVPQSAYFTDLKRFHFTSVDAISVRYINFAKNISGNKFVTEVRYFGKLKEPLFVIKGGDAHITLGGPTIFQFFYKLENIFEHIGNKVVLDTVMAAKQASVFPQYTQFIVAVPSGYEKLKFYYVDDAGTLSKVQEKDFVVSKVDGYKIASFVVGQSYVSEGQVNVRVEYPDNVVAALTKSREARSWEQRLSRRLFLYNVMSKSAKAVAVLAVILPSIYAFILWRRYGKETFSKVYAPVYVPSSKLQEFSFGALSLLYNYERNGAKRSITRGMVADLLELVRKQVFKLSSQKNDLGITTKVLEINKGLDNSIVMGKAAYKLASYIQDKLQRLKKLYLDEFILSANMARKYIKAAEKELKDADIYDNISMKIKKRLGRIAGGLVAVGVILFFVADIINSVLGSFTGVDIGYEAFVLLGLSLIVGGGISQYIYTKMQRLNRKGIQLYKELYGLKKYIQTAEIKRIQFLNDPSKLVEHFEVLLPYAIIFKLEKKWLGLFKRILAEYDIDSKTVRSVYLYNFSPSDVQAFEGALDSFESAVGSAIRTVSSSGGSFSFSGGGVSSSGGGFSGGGGASSW